MVSGNNEIIANLILELRRGTLVLSVLSQLEQPVYGYSLIQDLMAKGIEVEANTLYPLMRRLEKQGLLTSQWETTANKPRKYYVRSSSGNQAYQEMKIHWQAMVQNMNSLLDGGQTK